jgi:NADPH:quinone reductase-like Zn-dependent oxidoreductase
MNILHRVLTRVSAIQPRNSYFPFREFTQIVLLKLKCIPIMAFPYKHVLLIGATSGIGKGLADRLIKGGVKVTAVGRRKDKLDAFVSEHGEGRAAKAVAFDITNLEQIPKFAAEYVLSTALKISPSSTSAWC